MKKFYDLLSDEQRDILRYSVDIEAFINEVLGPYHNPPLHVYKFHKEWLDYFQNERYFMLLAPRRHGKTSMIGAYIIWRILLNPSITVFIITLNQDNADKMMSFIKDHLERNPRIKDLWGEQRGYREWSQSKIRVAKQGLGIREPTVTVQGVDSSMIGSGYDLIVLDDITNDKNSRTETLRSRLRDRYRSVILPMLKPDGQILVVGTRWHYDDIYHTLMESGFKHKIYRAIIEHPKEGKPAKVLWPEKWTYDTLINERKAAMGNTLFAMQYQNEVLPAEDAKIRLEWITSNYYTETESGKYKIIRDGTIINPDSLRIYQAYDLSAARNRKEKGDWFVGITIGIDDSGHIFILHMHRNKETFFRKLETINELYHTYTPIKIGIEANAMQKEIRDAMSGLLSQLPIVPVKTSTSKEARFERLSVLFEQGKIHLPKNKYPELVEELIQVPKGEYDDCVDALAFAVSVSGRSKPKDWKAVSDLIITKRVDIIM